jgi:predicted HAD superfamily phosphohydrolase YqeG
MNRLQALRPDLHIASFADLPVQQIVRQFMVRGLTLDIDQTFMEHHSDVVPDQHLAKFEEISFYGLRAVLLSNAEAKRVPRVEAITEQIYDKTRFRMPAPVTSHAVGHSKPDRRMFLAGAAALELLPTELGHVGDLTYRDIMGANDAGYRLSVHTAPYGQGGRWFVRNVEHPLEAGLLHILRPRFAVEPAQQPSIDDSLIERRRVA